MASSKKARITPKATPNTTTDVERIHDLFLDMVFRPNDHNVDLAISIAVPKMVSFDTVPKKILPEHIADPNSYFDTFVTCTPSLLTFRTGGVTSPDNKGSMLELCLLKERLARILINDPGLSYIEMWYQEFRIGDINEKRKYYNRIVAAVDQYIENDRYLSNDKCLQALPSSGVIRVSDIIERLHAKNITATDNPNRYRAELRKIGDKLIQQSTMGQLEAAHGMLLKVVAPSNIQMTLQVFISCCDTVNIDLQPSEVIDHLEQYNDHMTEQHPNMITLLFESTNDYEFFLMILNGIFSSFQWKMYCRVDHDWGIATSDTDVFGRRLFVGTSALIESNLHHWGLLTDAFNLYHVDLIRHMSDATPVHFLYADYVENLHATKMSGTVATARSKDHVLVPAAPIPVAVTPVTTPCNTNTETMMEKLKVIQRLTMACARIGVSNTFLNALECQFDLDIETLSGMTDFAELLASHSEKTRS